MDVDGPLERSWTVVLLRERSNLTVVTRVAPSDFGTRAPVLTRGRGCGDGCDAPSEWRVREGTGAEKLKPRRRRRVFMSGHRVAWTVFSRLILADRSLRTAHEKAAGVPCGCSRMCVPKQSSSVSKRMRNMAPSNDNNVEIVVQRFRRIVPIGAGEARQVYVGLLGEGADALLAEAVVYCFTEGFSRASGNNPGDYMRFHEHVHRDVGADLPEGLIAEVLREEALQIIAGDDLNDLTLTQIEDLCLEKGREFQVCGRSSGPHV